MGHECSHVCAGATLGFLVLVGAITAICCLMRRRRRYSEPPSPVYISPSETIRNPALRYLGKVSTCGTFFICDVPGADCAAAGISHGPKTDLRPACTRHGNLQDKACAEVPGMQDH